MGADRSMSPEKESKLLPLAAAFCQFIDSNGAVQRNTWISPSIYDLDCLWEQNVISILHLPIVLETVL